MAAITPAEAPNPRVGPGPLLPGQSRIDPATGRVTEGPELSTKALTEAAYREVFKGFGSRIDPNTNQEVFFQPANAIAFTGDRVREAFGEARPDESPDGINAWEMRIGGSRFVVPPINVNVSTSFRVGSMTGGALRSTSSPKFNSGYSETVVELTLYFPTHESIWGYPGTDPFTLNFDTDDYQVIDRYLSSLRGLITQFRYAPFLPVRSVYLNQIHNITGVALQSMTVSTIPKFPFCLAVNLTMLKFNHRVYLPMIQHFDNAIHWGKFRQYMGRAAARLATVASRDFLTEADIPTSEKDAPLGEVARTLVSPKELMGIEKADDVLGSIVLEDLAPTRTFDKMKEIEDGRWFEIYRPAYDPARIDLPDTADFKLRTKDLDKTTRNLWWTNLLGFAGIEVTAGTTEEDAMRYAESLGRIDNPASEVKLLVDYLNGSAKIAVTEMSMEKFNEYADKVIKDMGEENASPARKTEIKSRLRENWLGYMYEHFLQDPMIARALAFQDLKRKRIFIQEWEVPMVSTGLSEPGTREAIQIQGVTVSMGNNIARLQVQMQQEPTYQHIGGMDTTCSISMLVFGERPLMMMRQTFETTSGFARLEHGHGVLGFLGIKNMVTALCAMKYTMVASFEVDSVPNFPHVYEVRLTMTDFDIFQQKREILSAAQQAEMIDAFKSKKNPFLRIKQLWGVMNAYPDFPLAVRDDEGKVVGNLDPDFYFKAFETIDADIPTMSAPPLLDDADEEARRQARANAGASFLEQDGVHFSTGKTVENPNGNWISTTPHGVQLRNGTDLVAEDLQWDEPHAGNVLTEPFVEGLTPPSGYVEPYGNGNGSVLGQYERMMEDTRYRDKAGRMVRAFPTYMLWLIDEGGQFAGVKLFDNFYGLQSVIDFSLHRSEDVLGDTLVLKVSNLYSRLTTPFGDLLDDRYSKTATIINTHTQGKLRLASGFGDYLVRLDTIELAPGARVHLRMGYSSNPNHMDIVFNGVVTEVQTGEILTVICQSDAIELGALVNTQNKDGHSGKIDGNMVGLYLSEPRDLMIRLLTMGSSVFKEAFAHATQGKIFSESRYGIRHFGCILYQTLSDEEKKGIAARKDTINRFIGTPEQVGVGVATAGAGFVPGLIKGALSLGADIAGKVNPAIADIVDSMWVNMSMKNDYELFKRNIYPGNGFGIAQYLGGDLGEGAIGLAMQATGVDAAGRRQDSITGEPTPAESTTDPEGLFKDAFEFQRTLKGENELFLQQQADRSDGHGGQVHEFAKIFGIVSRGDDDVIDEVSFRAQTYMKSVWDIFQVCAALLPNYIVAVRPFEDRSTVFYGKPHWTYTSGVIPLSTGVGRIVDADGNEISNEPEYALPDEEWMDLFDKLTEELGKDRIKEDLFDELSRVTLTSGSDPTTTTAGVAWRGGDVFSLPSIEPGTGAKLCHQYGKITIEMHLPTSKDLAADVKQHKQTAQVPQAQRHPFYMDRVGGGVGGVAGNNTYSADGAIKAGDKGTDPGKSGAFGYLDPASEQFYMCQAWGLYGNPSKIGVAGARILVYNKRSGQACVCTPGDVGPNESTGLKAGLSPDAFAAIGAKQGEECFFGFVERSHPLGPVDMNKTATNGAPAANPVLVATPAVVPAAAVPGAPRPEDAWDPAVSATTDTVGVEAQRLYDNQRNTETAEAIWKEFRAEFRGENNNKKTYNDWVGDAPDQGEDKRFGIDLPDLPKIGPVDLPDLPAVGVGSRDVTVNDADYNAAINRFMTFLWGNAYGRAWVIYTADAKVSLGGNSTAGDVVETLNPLDDGREWNFALLQDLWKVYLEKGDKGAAPWMKDNERPGKDQAGVIGRAIEEGQREIIEPIKQIINKIGDVISGIYQSFSSFVRIAMLHLNMGMAMKQDMQRRTTMLNRVFNDSLYYRAGPPGSLWRLADNPFTREYGEPVVEIREPFQRVHYLSSFQHITKNQIMERSDGVYTVVTATSGGKHPVTVHFDKSSPAEFQREKSVETGLYWDKPGGIPIIKSIPIIGGAISDSINTVIHPVQALRQMNKTGASEDEISAKRVALWHLRESLKDIYGGELIVIGDASIRPHDLCYLSDVYERMYGLFEVEAVTHHFTPETGFITSIVPNALVTVNDPARWSMTAHMQSRMNVNRIRGQLREAVQVRADDTGQVPGQAGYSMDELVNMMEQQLLDSTQYSGGVSALVKEIGGSVAGGALVGAKMASFAKKSLPINPLSIGATLGGGLIWNAWEWVRDNLLDQHGCYIQYLTHNGQPMDAGMSPAASVAVGRQHGITLTMGALRGNITTKGDVPTLVDGKSVKPTLITTSELLSYLGWTPKEVDALGTGLDSFTQETHLNILRLTERGDTLVPFDAYEVLWVRVIGVKDGDTIKVAAVDGSLNGHSDEIGTAGGTGLNAASRLLIVDCEEDDYSDKVNMTESDRSLREHEDLGLLATRYTRRRLTGVFPESIPALGRLDTIAEYGNTVALRIIKRQALDAVGGRTLAIIFHQGLAGQTSEERKAFIMEAAASNIDFQNYTTEQRPYTFNQELLQVGHAKVEVTGIGRSVPGSGVIRSGG